MGAEEKLEQLLTQVRDCRLCENELPLGPRPVLRASVTSKILIVGQAPGTRVHATGIPWNDPSGDRLREWLRMDRETFYDESKIAIIPMGLCYPGKGKSGDLPPRPECARQWFEPLLEALPNLQLYLLIGQYAQAYYLGKDKKKSLTETVRHWNDYTPKYFPLPHPSPRNTHWINQRPWFDEQVLPALRKRVREIFPKTE